MFFLFFIGPSLIINLYSVRLIFKCCFPQYYRGGNIKNLIWQRYSYPDSFVFVGCFP